jgi:hypothetical protein
LNELPTQIIIDFYEAMVLYKDWSFQGVLCFRGDGLMPAGIFI